MDRTTTGNINTYYLVNIQGTDVVEGELELGNLNGGIEALDVAGVVVAHTTNGSVKVAMKRVSGDKPMAFSTLNGDVDVCEVRQVLPAETAKPKLVFLAHVEGPLQPVRGKPLTIFIKVHDLSSSETIVDDMLLEREKPFP